MASGTRLAVVVNRKLFSLCRALFLLLLLLRMKRRFEEKPGFTAKRASVPFQLTSVLLIEQLVIYVLEILQCSEGEGIFLYLLASK